MSSNRYPELVVRGTPREMGCQIGESTRGQVQQFCEIALERLNKAAHVSEQRARAVTEGSLAKARDYAPDLVEELQGVADGANVSLEQVMFLQVRNHFPPEDSGCTSVSWENVADVGPVVAQNWDNDPELDPLTVVLTRRPKDKPATLNLTQAGLIAYIGCNDQGIGACLNTLPAPQREIGVPHYFTLRRIYESASLDEAYEAVNSADRAIPANINLATPQGPADLEVTIDDVHILKQSPGKGLCHTNHCMHSALQPINNDFPELIQSGPRLDRIETLSSLAGDGMRLQDVQEMLRDHDGYPQSICRHLNDDPQTGWWQTVFSVIVAPAELSLYVTRGTPCDHPFERYPLQT